MNERDQILHDSAKHRATGSHSHRGPSNSTRGDYIATMTGTVLLAATAILLLLGEFRIGALTALAAGLIANSRLTITQARLRQLGRLDAESKPTPRARTWISIGRAPDRGDGERPSP